MPLYRPDIVQQTSCKAAAAVTWNALTFEVGQLWGGFGIPSSVHTKLMSTPAHLLLLLYRQETSCRRLPPRPLQSVVGRGQPGRRCIGNQFSWKLKRARQCWPTRVQRWKVLQLGNNSPSEMGRWSFLARRGVRLSLLCFSFCELKLNLLWQSTGDVISASLAGKALCNLTHWNGQFCLFWQS